MRDSSYAVLILVLVVTFSIRIAYAEDAGGAIDFDGTDDSIAVNGTFDPPEQGTIEFWVDADASDSRRLMGTHDAFEVRLDPDANGYIVDHQFFHGGDDTMHAVTVLPFGEWHHVAFTWDFSTKAAEIYIDGVLDMSGDLADDDPGAIALTIGARTAKNAEYFDGRLDEVRIWSEMRTEQQIQEFMNKGIVKPKNEAKLMAYWGFDEPDGTEVIDLSGNGFNGKMNNMDAVAARITSTAPVTLDVLPAGKLSTTWGWMKR